MKESADQYSDTIEQLQAKVQALTDENRLLKQRMDEAGIAYDDIESDNNSNVIDLYDPNQGARIKEFEITDKIASDFFMMFCRGRKDVFDLRYTNPKTGKNGYYTQCFNRWDRNCHIQRKDNVRCKDCEIRAYKPITLNLIKAHMKGADPNGNDVVAIYPMLENNLCQLLVFDFDNHAKGAGQDDYANIDDGWKEEINALRSICKNLNVDAVVERSRSGLGAHLWIFFKEMIPARLARRFGFALLEKGAESVNLKSFEEADINYKIEDKRTKGRKLNISFKGELRDSQILAVDNMLLHDNGILHAATAFGKTVVCCDMIAKRGVSTLIIVDKADLMNQWLKRLDEFLDIDEDLPEYKTKTGRIRKRKSLIGNLQGAHDTLTGIVDVAMIRSLKKKDGFHPMLKEYSQVYFDECHHAASDSAIEVLQEINAKYVYGVTATPKRGDGKEKINEFLLGPVRYRFTAKDRAKEQNIDHLVYPRFTRTVKPHHLSETPYGNDAFELIRNNDIRDAQIIRDVADCVQAGRTPVVLTKYVDHAKKLSERLRKYSDRLILLTGSNGTKARRKQVEELNSIDDEESIILVGTGSLLGEGFDFPRLDTLFMATPISGENVVEQYVGRLNRDYEGKKNVIVYDYVDSHIPKFDKMYASRMRAYKKIGYEICVDIDGEKQETSAIYDIENYAEIYWRDLVEAKTTVVISSPRLNNQKVNRVISVLGNRQELGVKVTIVTWHPDAYKYGRDDVRMELMERLRRAGFEIRLAEESCEHYAVIDNEIVWYGSMNLLSIEDAEVNIMRVKSKNIAAELLEITFGSQTNMQEW